jgi:hypothetical protein
VVKRKEVIKILLIRLDSARRNARRSHEYGDARNSSHWDGQERALERAIQLLKDV